MHYMNQANAHNATQDTTMQDSATHDTATKATQDTAPLKGITVIDWTQVQVRPVVHADARMDGRRRHQGGESAGRRSDT